MLNDKIRTVFKLPETSCETAVRTRLAVRKRINIDDLGFIASADFKLMIPE